MCRDYLLSRYITHLISHKPNLLSKQNVMALVKDSLVQFLPEDHAKQWWIQSFKVHMLVQCRFKLVKNSF